ncbi:MAG: hypothetical protein RLN69_16750 [Woeseiaceae bacterium]
MAVLFSAAACGGADQAEAPAGKQIETSGKEAAALDQLPPEVLAAALAAKPDLAITEAEYELRDGREYYDVGGTLPDGSEMELDMTRIDGEWTVVEFQRDISIESAPGQVREALEGARSGWIPERIIESDQGDGTVIYEFFGVNGAGKAIKVEVKWSEQTAEVLADEWAH